MARHEEETRQKEGKRFVEHKRVVNDVKPATITIVDGTGKAIQKTTNVPVFKEEDIVVAPGERPAGIADINGTALAAALVGLGFATQERGWRGFGRENEYEHVQTLKKPVEYEKKSSADPPTSCNIQWYQHDTKIVPFVGKSSRVPDSRPVDVIFDKLRPHENTWKFVFQLVALDRSGGRPMHSAPAEAVGKCAADLGKALSRARFAIEDYPDRVLTPSEIEGGGF
jgi:hypothetical protein